MESGPITFRVKGPRSFEIQAPSITVGTTSASAIALRDPVASEEHCRISRRGEGFVVEDLSSGIGTYVNGVPVKGPVLLAPGDSIVVGVSRLALALTGTTRAPILEITVEEASFHYQKSGSEGARRDADDWVADEVGFGRSTAVRVAGGIAVVLAASGLAWIAFSPEVGRAVLSPGPLIAEHAALLSMTPEELALDPRWKDDPRLVSLALEVAGQGCSMCHDAYDGTPMSKCAACHEDKLTASHPFRPAPIAPSTASFRGWRENDCILCHSDHKGPENPRSASFPDSTSQTCATCHSEESIGGLVEEFQHRVRPDAGGRSPPVKTVEIAYADFSHRAHLQSGVEIACGMCHAPRKNGAARDERDFQPVTFESCQRCHDTQAGPRDLADDDLAARLAGSGLLFDVPLHGTDEEGRLCSACHAGPDRPQGELKQVAKASAEPLRFRLTRRDHREVQAAMGSSCAECHHEPLATAGATSEGVFLHGTHLAEMQPELDQRERASAACLACHAAQASSGGLSAGLEPAAFEAALQDAESCARCHRDDQEQPLLHQALASRWGESTMRPDFPHDRHMGKVAGGCFACHAFDDAGDPFGARPTTRPGAANCTECHSSHENVGGGTCARCHPPAAAGGAGSVFAGRPAFRDDWPQNAQFDHFTRGHSEVIADPEGACGSCHDLERTARATRTVEVPIPSRAEGLCVDCHVEKRALFHFRDDGS